MTYIQPLLSIWLLLIAAGLLPLGRRGRRPWLAWLGLAGLFVTAWPPAAWLLARPLEAWYSPVPSPDFSAQAIVVLASTAEFAHDDLLFDVPGHDTYRRCLQAVWLYKHWAPRPILVSGGPMASTMQRVIESEGVPPADVFAETSSLDTHTNALYSAPLLAQRRISMIALVVDARDMPRAKACFVRQGLVVVPVPIAFLESDFGPADFLPAWSAISSNEHTLHEVLGLIWYRLRGWI